MKWLPGRLGFMRFCIMCETLIVGSVEKVQSEVEVKASASKESATSKSKEKPGKKDAKKNEKVSRLLWNKI